MPNIFHNSLSLGYPVGGGGSYPTDGLISRWQFEDNLNDDSGNGFNLTNYSGSPTWIYSTGEVGKAYNSNTTSSFTGTVGLQNVTDSSVYKLVQGTNKYSISYWAKITNTSADLMQYIEFIGGTMTIAFGGASYKPSGGVNGCWFIIHGGLAQIISNTDYRDNTWRHFVQTSDGTNINFYINTVNVNTLSVRNMGTCTRFNLGSSGNTPKNWDFNGMIDQFYMYDRALNTTEIGQLYNSGAGI